MRKIFMILNERYFYEREIRLWKSGLRVNDITPVDLTIVILTFDESSSGILIGLDVVLTWISITKGN